MKKISWLFDGLGMIGASLFLVGFYIALGLAALLMASGLMLLAYAFRMSYLCHDDTDQPVQG